MNREQRRVAARARLNPVDWSRGIDAGCPTVATIADLVQNAADGWIVEAPPCERCGQHTIVAHAGAEVFACLSCGMHGKSGAPGREPDTHTADGMRLH